MTNKPDIGTWVMNNIDYLKRWRWSGPNKQAVVAVTHGYWIFSSSEKAKHPGSMYRIEFSHFYVVDENGEERESWPHGDTPVPQWLLDAMDYDNQKVPCHMPDVTFKKLVDDGVIIANGEHRWGQ